MPETILTDPARLRQLLMNLVGNAIKFTERGSVTLLATVAWDSTEPRFLIEVRDTGIGISAERLSSIFNPFEQADSSITRRFGGTGLGLAISRHIAEGLGGEITAESEVGWGSVFRTTLATGPLECIRKLESPPTEALRLIDAPKPISTSELSGARVLLVEDGASNRDLISLVLHEAGAEVTCAKNGRDGLEAATKDRFDLILMDMQMPVMDGYTATSRLRERDCRLPIIALTAHAMRGDSEKCYAAGCNGYLTKPLDIDELIQTVADALRTGLNAANSYPWQTPDPPVAQKGNSAPALEIISSLPRDNPSFRPIIESYLIRLHEQLKEMRAAHKQADWNKVMEIGHWLRGSGGTIGFKCFTEPAQRLEQLARTGQIDQLADTIDEISALVDRVVVPT